MGDGPEGPLTLINPGSPSPSEGSIRTRWARELRSSGDAYHTRCRKGEKIS
ncbi:MAG: hypothetical protein JRI46_09600 [Deltaproteobacteria bacterium]|nr:hypothetical protein [Deltaproteobacteria bacterium]